MRGFLRLVVCVCVLLGPLGAAAAGGPDHSSTSGSWSGGQPPGTEQLGQVVGSFALPSPPIPPTPPYDNIPGLEHDGHGNLYCSDLSVPQFFVVDTNEPIAQLIDGPFAATHSAIPKGITTDLVHVYVADVSAPADIDVYDLAGGYIGSFSVDAHTHFPEGISFNRITGHLYVVDGQNYNRVSEFTVDGTFIQDFTTLNGFSHDGLAFDPDRCSYWIYDSGTDTVRHYDLNFLEMESFSGPASAGFGNGEGVAVIGDRLYVMASSSGVPTVVVFDVTNALLSPQIDLCRIFEDGFESGDISFWSGVGP